MGSGPRNKPSPQIIRNAVRRETISSLNKVFDLISDRYPTNGLDFNHFQQDIAEYLSTRLAIHFNTGLMQSIEFANADLPKKMELFTKFQKEFSKAMDEAMVIVHQAGIEVQAEEMQGK
jgi:hypothetical protein